MMRTIATGVCVALTAAAAFIAQSSANHSEQAVYKVQSLSVCNQRIMAKTLIVLNERSTYTKATADANINLQQSQADFFGILLHRPPYSENRRTQSSFDYYHDLQEFLNLAKKSRKTVADNPFPTIRDYNRCIRQEEEHHAQ